MKEDQLTGIILSGGKSSRMGMEKGLVDFQGKPLISYAVSVLESIVDSIIIGANNELDSYKKFGHQVVEDEIRGIGPIGGLLSTLRHADTQKNIVISCDMPFINSELLRYLFQNMGDADVVVATQGPNKTEPLCGVYSQKAIPIIEDAIQNDQYKILDLFDKVSFKSLLINETLPFYSDNLFYNINRPEDIRD